MVSMFSLSLKKQLQLDTWAKCDVMLCFGRRSGLAVPSPSLCVLVGRQGRGGRVEQGNGEKEEEVAAPPARVLRTLDGFVP